MGIVRTTNICPVVLTIFQKTTCSGCISKNNLYRLYLKNGATLIFRWILIGSRSVDRTIVIQNPLVCVTLGR